MSDRPMLCENCKARLPKNPSLLQRLANANDALSHLGYYDTLAAGCEAVRHILESNGFAVDYPLVSFGQTRLHLEVGENKWLTLTWYRFESTGRYEIVAYVN